MTVPLKVYLPSISEPSSMKALRSLGFMGGLALALRENIAGLWPEAVLDRGPASHVQVLLHT
jgi:hypothetical protein